MRITKKDIAILKERASKPDQKLREIAKKVELSHVAVSKSIKKLENTGLIKNTLSINLEKTEWTYGLLKLNVINADSFIEKKKGCPFVISSSKSDGEYNVIFEICAYNQESLQRFIGKCVMSSEDVKKNLFESLRNRTPSFIQIDFAKIKSECVECLNCKHYKSDCNGCGIDAFLKALKILKREEEK